MSSVTRMVIDDPSKFHLLTVDMKEKIIEGGIATVNMMAGMARKNAVKNIQSSFITRNKFTAKQVQFTPMPKGRYSLNKIQSIVGITEKASYMKRQEEGGDHTPTQGSTLAIPTDAARGYNKRSQVNASMRVSAIRKKSRRVHGESSARLAKYKGKGKNVPKNKKITTRSRKSNFVSRAYIAWKHNLFMPAGPKKERNVFIVKNFRKVSRGKPEFEMEMVTKFDLQKTKTKSQPWLLPACEKVVKDAQKIFESQMKKLGM